MKNVVWWTNNFSVNLNSERSIEIEFSEKQLYGEAYKKEITFDHKKKEARSVIRKQLPRINKTAFGEVTNDEWISAVFAGR